MTQGGRPFRTRREEAAEAVAEEATLLAEEIARLRAGVGGESTPEYAAVMKLIDGLRPHLPADRLAELEVLMSAHESATLPVVMERHTSTLVSGNI